MLFKSKPRPRGGAILPLGFIVPCQPKLVDKVPLGPEWIHEFKYDGFRLMNRKAGGKVQIWTRPGNERSKDFTAVREAIAALPDGTVIDGEAVVEDEDTEHNFAALHSKDGCARADLYAFDLLFDGGNDIRSLPLEERRARLSALIGNGRPGLYSSGHVPGADGQKMFDFACSANLEGIVSKRLGSRYRSGPTDNWRKIKCKEYRRD